MPHLTQSPISSPSLRSIAHAQMKSSYFPSVPNTSHSYHSIARIAPPPPPTPHSSLNVYSHGHGHGSPGTRSNSTLVSCLKGSHSRYEPPQPPSAPPSARSNVNNNLHNSGQYYVASPVSESTPPYYRGDHPEEYLRPAMKSLNLTEKRRTSLKVSQIPLGNNSGTRALHTSTNVQAQMHNKMPYHHHLNEEIPSHHSTNIMNNAQPKGRRPSFKIELPPRPNVNHQNNNMMHTQLKPLSNNTPFASTLAHHQEIANTLATRTGRGPVFIDPFEGSNNNNNNTYDYPAGGYMILRAPTKNNLNSNSFLDDFPSPTQPLHNQLGLERSQTEMIYGEDGIGLGYSLNKRIATPWLRSKGDEEEWLKADDLQGFDGSLRDVEKTVRGLGIA
ncbi:uncharacterized protein L201_004486 [Kwoniella dendrophila CBS 6074]|uniref:Uncharacterized protein n=1 Tax=Kwoniella dendrophila CBS 6074 TaxID=1295534 RepID=A0AAX4JXW9_9TREE